VCDLLITTHTGRFTCLRQRQRQRAYYRHFIVGPVTLCAARVTSDT
jgi:hypothetical protein